MLIILFPFSLSTYGNVNSPDGWQIGFGHNDLVQIFNRNQYKPIKSFHRHPDYQFFPGTLNDIALIQLEKPLEFSDAVQPACLDLEDHSLFDGALKVSSRVLDF